MKVTIQNIQEYLPQKKPFVMIDSLVEASINDGFVSMFLIEEDNLMVENRVFKEVGLIENMAQTVAAGFTYLDKQQADANAEPKVGFIGSVNKLKIIKSPLIGDRIETKVKIEMSFENITLVSGITYLQGEEIMSCEMKIAIVDGKIMENE